MWDGGVKLSFPHPLHTALVGRIAHVFELDLHSNLKYTHVQCFTAAYCTVEMLQC